MEIMEEFDGTLDVLNEDEDDSYFTVVSRTNGDILQGSYPSSFFRKKEMRENQRFTLRVIKLNNKIDFEIEPVPLKKLTAEQKEEIEKYLKELEEILPPDTNVKI